MPWALWNLGLRVPAVPYVLNPTAHDDAGAALLDGHLRLPPPTGRARRRGARRHAGRRRTLHATGVPVSQNSPIRVATPRWTRRRRPPDKFHYLEVHVEVRVLAPRSAALDRESILNGRVNLHWRADPDSRS